MKLPKSNRTLGQVTIRTLSENLRIAQTTWCAEVNSIIADNGKNPIVFTFHIIFHNHGKKKEEKKKVK